MVVVIQLIYLVDFFLVRLLLLLVIVTYKNKVKHSSFLKSSPGFDKADKQNVQKLHYTKLNQFGPK